MSQYIVVSGDTLISIAATQCSGSLTWQQIAVDNQLANPDVIQVGQVLTLNCVGTAPIPAPNVLHWGVDSAGRASSLFDTIAQADGAPQFWGRYIGGSFALTSQEANFVFTHSHGTCRILVIYNGAKPSIVATSFAAGVQDATNAINAAKALGVPTNQGIVIYADIEASWKPSAAWILGWWSTMKASVYGNEGGFYCNPGGNFSNGLCAAINDPSNRDSHGQPLYRPVLYSSEPENVPCSFDRSFFRPGFPLCCTADSVRIWQYHETCGSVDMDLATEVGYATMWHS